MIIFTEYKEFIEIKKLDYHFIMRKSAINTYGIISRGEKDLYACLTINGESVIGSPLESEISNLLARLNKIFLGRKIKENLL